MSLLPRFLILAVAVLCVTCKILPLPSYITPCYRDDPNLDECGVKNGQLAIPMIVKGDRKYKIPIMDPLEIDKLVIARGNGTVSIDLEVRKVKLIGFKETQIKSAKFDVAANTITLNLFNPSLQLAGDSTISGSILILPITGQGPGYVSLVNADWTYVLKYNLVKKDDGREYLVPSGNHLSISVTRMHLRFDNLFNGDKALSDNMNRVMNDNWQVMLQDLGPSICEGIGDVLQQIVTGALRDVPFDVIFPTKP